MEKQIRDSLHRVVDYLREQERKHYDEQGKPAGHIFLDVQQVWYWLRGEFKKDGLNIM